MSVSAGMGEPQTKSERTRQRILDAAAQVFKEQSYANARLADIAALAGMKTGSLYYHFASREELVAEILRLGIEISWAHVRSAVDALPANTDPLTRLAAAVRAHTLSVLKISDYTTAQTRIVSQVPPEVRRGHLADQHRYGSYWNELIEAAADADALRDGIDPFIGRMLIFGAMNWTAEWYTPRRGTTVEQIADQAVAMVLHGLAAPPKAKPKRAPIRRG